MTGAYVAESKSSGNKTDTLSFEQALERLTTLVEKLESGKLPLEESVAAFEEGVKLTRRCEALLDSAEQRLQVLGEEKSQ
jgi:exodeoxyribonuclease VII small subunit